MNFQSNYVTSNDTRHLDHPEQKKAAFGIFKTLSEVREARTALQARGFLNSNIEVLYPPHFGTQGFVHEQKSLIRTGGFVGSAVGGLLFMTLGILISTETITVPGIHYPLTLQDHILWTLASLVSGIIFGSACGALVGIGTPEPASQRYGQYVDSGGILMSVHVNTTDEVKDAKEALDKTGAQDINLLNENQSWKTVYSKIFHA